MGAAEYIDEQLKGNKVVVFSKSYCPYCTKTKQLFKQLNVDAKVIELDQRDDGADIQSALASRTGQKTVPSVWIKESFIGGNDDTQKKNSSGELAKLLA
ncbi:GRXC4 [Acrasis kona]|uniref:GRXC4 n=1 Tax=Acrasis kona TaxID=1008807 RepID=A0AAW2YKM4_9EUKA